MNSDKILNILPKLKTLSEDDLQKIDKAVDACMVVQALKRVTSNTKIVSMEQIL